MDHLQDSLQTLGLSATEAEIYLAGLAQPDVGATQLAHQTGIKRPTVYHALETLLQKGLVSKKGTGTHRIFTMTAPQHISRLLDAKMEQLKKQKEGLDALVALLVKQQRAGSTGSIEVKQYQGIDGIKLVVEEALYCRSRRWDILAPRKNFFSEFDPDYAQYYLSARKKRGIVSRSLWESLAGKHLTQEFVAERNPRLLPASMHGKFQTVMILFDEKVALISSYKALSAILLDSKELHDFFTAMFDGLWERSSS